MIMFLLDLIVQLIEAKIDITYIGKNSMIDNLVHIAHNVYIG